MTEYFLLLKKLYPANIDSSRLLMGYTTATQDSYCLDCRAAVPKYYNSCLDCGEPNSDIAAMAGGSSRLVPLVVYNSLLRMDELVSIVFAVYLTDRDFRKQHVVQDETGKKYTLPQFIDELKGYPVQRFVDIE